MTRRRDARDDERTRETVGASRDRSRESRSGGSRPTVSAVHRSVGNQSVLVQRQTGGQGGTGTRSDEASSGSGNGAAALIDEHSGRAGNLDETALASVLLNEYLRAGNYELVGDVFDRLSGWPWDNARQVAKAIADQASESEFRQIVANAPAGVKRVFNSAQTGHPTYGAPAQDQPERSRERASLQSMQGVVEHVVESGDTLSELAREYDVPGGWNTIWEANREVIGPNPDRIYPDQVLYIPQTEAAAKRLKENSQHERMEALESLAGSQ